MLYATPHGLIQKLVIYFFLKLGLDSSVILRKPRVITKFQSWFIYTHNIAVETAQLLLFGIKLQRQFFTFNYPLVISKFFPFFQPIFRHQIHELVIKKSKTFKYFLGIPKSMGFSDQLYFTIDNFSGLLFPILHHLKFIFLLV